MSRKHSTDAVCTRCLDRTNSLDVRGFTLIELVVTIMIVAILSAIAVPAYNNYVLKSHRTDAKTALLDLASLEERFFSTQNYYSQLPTDLGYSNGSFPVSVSCAGGSSTCYYSISQTNFTAATPPSAASPGGTPAYYQFTATAINAQLGDSACQTFTVDSRGVQTSAPATTGCW